MCMQYINANIALFKEISGNKKESMSFTGPFNKIVADGKTISEFSIVSYFTLMGSSGKKANNVVDNNGKLDVCIRLTKCTPDDNERISYDLDKFLIDTEDEANIIYDDACVPYLNYKRISNIGKIDINLEHPEGSYVVKILVKNPDEKKYVVQSMHHLIIE